MRCGDGQQLIGQLRFPKATAVAIGKFIEVFLEFVDIVKRAEKTSFEIRDGWWHGCQQALDFPDWVSRYMGSVSVSGTQQFPV